MKEDKKETCGAGRGMKASMYVHAHVHMYMYVCVKICLCLDCSVRAYISRLLPLRKPSRSKPAQHRDVGLYQDSSEKWLISELGQDIKTYANNDGGVAKGRWSSRECSYIGQIWDDLSTK